MRDHIAGVRLIAILVVVPLLGCLALAFVR
jgi:hypothetical protein